MYQHFSRTVLAVLACSSLIFLAACTNGGNKGTGDAQGTDTSDGDRATQKRKPDVNGPAAASFAPEPDSRSCGIDDEACPPLSVRSHMLPTGECNAADYPAKTIAVHKVSCKCYLGRYGLRVEDQEVFTDRDTLDSYAAQDCAQKYLRYNTTTHRFDLMAGKASTPLDISITQISGMLAAYPGITFMKTYEYIDGGKAALIFRVGNATDNFYYGDITELHPPAPVSHGSETASGGNH